MRDNGLTDLKRTPQGQYRTSNWEAAYLAAGCILAAIGVMSLSLATVVGRYSNRSTIAPIDLVDVPATLYAAGAALILALASFILYAKSRSQRRH